MLWDGLAGQPSRVLGHGKDGVLALATDGAGRILAAGGHDGRLVAWRLPFGEVLFDAKVADGAVGSVAIDTDPDQVVVGDQAGVIQVCRLSEKSCRRVAHLTRGPVRQIEFDATQKRWRTAAFGMVQVWSADWSSLETHKASTSGPPRLRWHPSTRRLAFAGESQKVVVTAQGQDIELEGLRTGINDFAFAPSGEELAVASASIGVRIWSVISKRVTRTLFGLQGSANSVSWSSDGKYIAAGGDGEAMLWDAKSATLLTRFSGPFGRDINVAFSTDGKTLAIAGRKGRALVVDVGHQALLEAARARAKNLDAVLRGNSWDDLWNFGPPAPEDSQVRLRQSPNQGPSRSLRK